MQHRSLTQHIARVAPVAAVLSLVACTTVGPNYQRPVGPAVEKFKETPPPAREPALPEKWWTVFGDARLNELEEAALKASPNLQAAAARVTQARAIARVTEADLFPAVTFDPEASRSRQSANRPVQPGSPLVGYTANRFKVPLDAIYEIDFWGKIRRAEESALARAEAAADAYWTAMLTLTSDVAQNYLAIRSLDAESALLRNTIDLRKQGLELIQARFKGGIASELDVARAQTELASTQSEAIGLGKRRAELENALATLLAKTPAEFSLVESPLSENPPQVPVGMPSELLKRRPDVAEAERLLAARNADIGVAQAAFFPSIRLTGQLGLESADLKNLIKSPSRIGGLGIAAVMPVFEGGRNRANVDRAKAAFDENLAQYRQRVLVAFQEVDSALAGLRILAEQSGAQSRSVASARRSSQLSNARYKSGLVNYLEVIDTERTTLATQRLATQLVGQRLGTTVALIKALGGGWREAKAVNSSAPPQSSTKSN
jgi:outer membrane protein, multidrug efflux system